MGAGDPGIPNQNGFRGRADTVDEDDDTTWFAPINTNWVASALDTNFRVRFEIRVISLNNNWDTGQFRVYYSHNNGSFTRITTTSSVIKSVSSNVSGYDRGDDTTQLISSETPFKVDNNQVNAGGGWTLPFTWLIADGNTQYVETEWVLQIISADVSSCDTIELRLRKFSGAVLTGGYTHSPVITIDGSRTIRRIIIIE